MLLTFVCISFLIHIYIITINKYICRKGSQNLARFMKQNLHHISGVQFHLCQCIVSSETCRQLCQGTGTTSIYAVSHSIVSQTRKNIFSHRTMVILYFHHLQK